MSTRPYVSIGSEFLGYRIEELVGRGGMGVVFRAYDLRLKRPVALKFVAPALARDARFRERFARESELVMSLEHSNVVPIYDAGEADGRIYLAMRLVDGTDLGSLLRTEGALEPTRALAIARQLAAALDAAHARGLVHRDVKPSNVLLDSTEHVYLADFGLTRRLEQATAAVDDASLGTPAYLAPEQLEGHEADARADVYSLGCLIYECLTGEQVFPRTSRLAVAWAHLEEEPPRASARRQGLPDRLDAVLARAMAKSPDKRFASCSALTSATEEALGLRSRPSRRHRALVVAAAVVLISAAVTGAAAVGRRGAGSRASVTPVQADTLVRIDPHTNTVSHVIRLDGDPVALAVAGSRVWAYSRDADAVDEIDTRSNRLLRRTFVRVAAADFSAGAGPVLAADSGGAWIVGTDSRDRFLLARVRRDGGQTSYYPLQRRPVAVTDGEGAVWVLGSGPSYDELLRFDPVSGKVTGRSRLPERHIDSLAAGLGAIWAVNSETATLYRVDARTARLTGRVDLGTNAERPSVVHGSIWVGLSDGGGSTALVNPNTMVPGISLACCPLADNSSPVGAYGSAWRYDAATGTVVRWNGSSYGLTATIQVTQPPEYGGNCLTSLATGADAVWVTVAPSYGFTCSTT